MIEEDFYATVKLKTGEEIFAKVAPSEEDDQIFLLVTDPIIITHFKNRSGSEGYKIEPWLKTTTEDLFVINLNDVITMSESRDVEIIYMYQNYIRKKNQNNLNNGSKNITRKMGYIANILDAKELLEKIYKKS